MLAHRIGSIALKGAARAFTVVGGLPLPLGKWNEHGFPFFSEGVACRAPSDVAPAGKRTAVALLSWSGSVARALVNRRPAGTITAPPRTCDLTDRAVQGTNPVEAVVMGTLKNTLGPHPGKNALGSAWTTMLQAAPEGSLPPGATCDAVR